MRLFGYIVAVTVALANISCHLDEDLLELRKPIDFFYVSSLFPEDGQVDVPLNQPISLTFNDYLDSDSFEYYDAISIMSGSIFARGITRYEAATRTLTFFPTQDLHPRIIYTLTVNPDSVRSLDGLDLSFPPTLEFQTADAGTVEQNRRLPNLSFDADVAPIISEGCSCHSGTSRLASLAHADIVGVRSQQLPERDLVLPFDPDHSYLLHKVLPDYPDRRLLQMPPPWSGFPPLTTDELLVLERWIEMGAAE